MPVKVNADQFTKRWEDGLRGAGKRIEDGINSVTEAPGAKAAAQLDAYLAGVQRSSNKWATNVASVSLENWKQSAIKKGIPALTNSVEMAKPKVRRAAERLIPALNDLMGSLPPRGTTIDQNIERVRHMANGLREKFS